MPVLQGGQARSDGQAVIKIIWYRLRSGHLLPRLVGFSEDGQRVQMPDPPWTADRMSLSAEGPWLPLGGKWATSLNGRLAWIWNPE